MLERAILSEAGKSAPKEAYQPKIENRSNSSAFTSSTWRHQSEKRNTRLI